MKKIKLTHSEKLLTLDAADEIIIYKKQKYRITHSLVINTEIIRPIPHLIIEEDKNVNLTTILAKILRKLK